MSVPGLRFEASKMQLNNPSSMYRRRARSHLNAASDLPIWHSLAKSTALYQCCDILALLAQRILNMLRNSHDYIKNLLTCPVTSFKYIVADPTSISSAHRLMPASKDKWMQGVVCRSCAKAHIVRDGHCTGWGTATHTCDSPGQTGRQGE